MSLNLRTTILATGCILAIGTSAARAQMSPVFYYSAPGSYATTQGTVNIPVAGYYYNVPLYTVAAPVNPAPAQRYTYSYFYYPSASSFRYRAGANVLGVEPMSGSAYGGTMLMAPSGGGQDEGGAGGYGANILRLEPMTGSAYGGGALMAPSR